MTTFLAIVLLPVGFVVLLSAMVAPFAVVSHLLDREYKGAAISTLVMAVSYALSYGYISLFEHAL